MVLTSIAHILELERYRKEKPGLTLDCQFSFLVEFLWNKQENAQGNCSEQVNAVMGNSFTCWISSTHVAVKTQDLCQEKKAGD